MRRDEKAGTRSHLSLLSHCWRQPQQTLCERCDGRGGGYEALFREELASLSLKQNHQEHLSFLRIWLALLSGRCAASAILFFANLSIFAVVSSQLYFSFAPLYSLLPLFALQLSLFSRLLFQMHFVRQQINFFWTVERWISKHSFTKYSRYTIADIIIISCSKITFVRYIVKNFS